MAMGWTAGKPPNVLIGGQRRVNHDRLLEESRTNLQGQDPARQRPRSLACRPGKGESPHHVTHVVAPKPFPLCGGML